MKLKFFSATCCALAIACMSMSSTAQAGPAAPMQLALMAQPVDCSEKATKAERTSCRVEQRNAQKARNKFLKKKKRECEKKLKQDIANGNVPQGTVGTCNMMF